MAEKEVRAEFPWQFQGEDPDACKPHPGVIVQVSGRHQLLRPMVEACDPGSAGGRGFIVAREYAILVQLLDMAGHTKPVALPDIRAMRQPSFKIAAPEDLLNKFFCGLIGMSGKNSLQYFRFRDEPMS